MDCASLNFRNLVCSFVRERRRRASLGSRGAGGHGSWGASDERREAQISMPEAIAWDARAFDSGVIAIPATPRTGMGSRIPFASIMI